MDDPRPSPPAQLAHPARPAHSARRALALLIGAALVLRVVFALRKGLVLDELHSLFHAGQAGSAAFWESLARDNHPPLSFLVLGLARALAGEGELALRLPALAAGLAELALLAQLARRLGTRARLAAVGLLAASSLHLDFSTQARMYAWLALAVSGLTLSTVRALEAGVCGGGRARWRVAGWIALGFHAHYFFVQYGLGLALGALAAAALVPAARPGLRALAAPAALGVALCLPWALTGFRAQLAHGLPPGGDDAGLAGLGEAFVHLFYLNVRLGGPALRLAFIGCGGLVLVLGASGALALLRDRERRALGVVCAASAFGVPLGAALLASLWPRAGFTWHYVLPSAAPMALLAAAGLRGRAPRLRRAAFGLALGAAVVLSLLNAASRGSEDFPGAVRRILAGHRPGDVVVSVEWQPVLFPQGMPWDHYAPRLAADPPPRLGMRGYDVADPAALLAARRVLLLRSKLPEDQPLMRRLREHFEERSVEGFGFGRWVHVLERR